MAMIRKNIHDLANLHAELPSEQEKSFLRGALMT